MKALYDHPIKGARKLSLLDLRGIAHFNRIIRNYLKMYEIEKRYNNGQTHRH